jgi:hypothetical protein
MTFISYVSGLTFISYVSGIAFISYVSGITFISYVSGIAFISYAQIPKIGKPNNSNFLEQHNKRARTRSL